MNPLLKHKHRRRAKLIFNPGSGETGASPVQLMDVIREMQAWRLVPEAFLVEPGCDLPAVIREAIADGIRLFVVCGGDGTVDAVAAALAGTSATLGIIPTGTQNNVARSLGIPEDIPAAIAILQTGRRKKVDMGLAASGAGVQPFLEICSVGLFSSLYPAADDIQHGNLARIGDFLTALASSPPAEMRLNLDGKRKITTLCHVVLVSNTPSIGPHFQVSDRGSMEDGLLDVLLFADLSKMDLLAFAAQVAAGGNRPEDERIQRHHVRSVDVDTDPPMPVMADGLALGSGPVRIRIRRHALAVMAGEPATAPPVARHG